MFSRIYAKIKSSRIKSVLQYIKCGNVQTDPKLMIDENIALLSVHVGDKVHCSKLEIKEVMFIMFSVYKILHTSINNGLNVPNTSLR